MALMKQRLEQLQCHFTWRFELEYSRSILFTLRYRLQDICTEDSIYVGHIYNLQGFIHYKLGLTADALQLFTRATEAFRRVRAALEGPWLLVNYGDLAWLHHELGQQEDTETYLSHIQALLSASETEEVHPEVLAEKAWSLKEFSKYDKLLAVTLFQKALEMEPDRVEWRSSQAIALLNADKKSRIGVDDDILQKVKMAHEQDPGNLNLCAEYLNQRVKRGEDVMQEVSELTAKVLKNPLSNHRVFKIVLWIYQELDSVDLGILWVEDALKKHPESRYLKRCLTLCYKWKTSSRWFIKEGSSNLNLLKKAVSLHKEVITLYPDSCLEIEIDLANIYAIFDRNKAEELYQDLMQREMVPRDKQMVYNRYAKHSQYVLKDVHRSIKYHRMVVRIDYASGSRVNSMVALKKLKESSWEAICAEIQMSPMKQRLEELQCHFTWELEYSRSILFTVRDRLQDMSTEDSIYEGHIYNLQAFIHYKLGLTADALQLFTRATEAFRRVRAALEGPWLLVNYGDLAWLHHELGQQEDTETYLSHIQALLSASETEEVHPEVLAEKAWSLKEFSKYDKLLAVALFQKALEMEPDRVEWQVCQVLALVDTQKPNRTKVSDDVFQKIKLVVELVPDQLSLRVEYLNQRAKRGEDVKNEVTQLAPKVLENPHSSYNEIETVLLIYKSAFSIDATLNLGKKAAQKYPESRHLKMSLTLCYKWKINVMDKQGRGVSMGLIDSATCLLKEVISLNPSLTMEIDLANIYATSQRSFHLADQKYQELLQRDYPRSSKQILYHSYAKFLHFKKRDAVASAEFHMKVIEIPIESHYKATSIATLECTKTKHDDRMRQKIDNLLKSIKKN